jgi:PPOX class probable F420-dependent enzyme
MSPDEALEFVPGNRRAVLITRRRGGGLQTSPVLVGVDGEGKVVISTWEAAYKTRNLRRDPRVVLCVLSDDFFGRWIQIEGTAQIVSLPEAMEGLSTTTAASALKRHSFDWRERECPCRLPWSALPTCQSCCN